MTRPGCATRPAAPGRFSLTAPTQKGDNIQSEKGETIQSDLTPGQAVELLCKDKYGAYNLPFLCVRRDDAWINAETGKQVAMEVLGWRIRTRFRSKSPFENASVNDASP